jgi:hypothetical protein
MKKNKKTLKEVLETTAMEVVTEKIKNYRGEVSKQIDDALLSIIGLEQRGWNGGKYEIDHCNGRNSVLIDAFRNIAKVEAEKIARSYKPTKEDLAGFQEAFAKEYRSQIMYSLRDMAKSKAQTDFREFADNQKIDIQKIVTEALEN